MHYKIILCVLFWFVTFFDCYFFLFQELFLRMKTNDSV